VGKLTTKWLRSTKGGTANGVLVRISELVGAKLRL
jgi:hypothetical protein